MFTHRPISPCIIGAIIIWLLIMIGTPVALSARGNDVLVDCILAGVLSQAFVVGIVFFCLDGGKSVLYHILPIILLGWLVEYVGSTTGMPFGSYQYTRALQPQVGGVPIHVPIAWLMMLPPAWGIAFAIIKAPKSESSIRLRLARSGIAAVAFTAWDLFLDPQMVGWGFWEWHSPGMYYGIPLINFLGWFLVSFLFSIILMPKRLPFFPILIVIYALTWILQTVGQIFFWDLHGAAIFGFVGMGSMVLLASIVGRK